MKKLVIFDMDGTLADTSPGILNCIRYTQQKMGLPEITEEQMYSHVGPPMEESYARNFGLSGERLKLAVGYHKEYALKQGYRELTVYPGIYDLLDDLRDQGTLTAVATLKAQATTEKILAEYDLSKRFDIVIGTNSENPMTKAEMICHCMDKLSCSHPVTVLVGDSSYDAVAAKQAGIDFVAVTYGFGFKTADEAQSYGSVFSCESIQALSQYLIYRS